MAAVFFAVIAAIIPARVTGQQMVVVAALPDAPYPQEPSSSPSPKPNPCHDIHGEEIALPSPANAGIAPPSSAVRSAAVPCTERHLNWYQTFVNGPRDKPLSPKDKGWLAARNLVDPFNLITIGGEAGISIAADSHSPYGPGMPGYARYVGVSFTEDMTGEFFGTFLIPSVVHQDPHYHRLAHASIPRRVGHALLQVLWTRSDYDTGMLNYANLAGFALDDEIANLYVPGRETDASATATRYATGLATAPIGNLVDEFLPDVASHIHVQIVVIQRIINQVARNASNNTAQ